MRTTTKLALIPVAVAAFACSGGRRASTVAQDTSLSRDLQLAADPEFALAASNAGHGTQVVSGIELGTAGAPKTTAPQRAPQRITGSSLRPAVKTAPSRTHHDTPAPAAQQQEVARAPEPAPAPVTEAPAPAPTQPTTEAPAPAPTTQAPAPAPEPTQPSGGDGGGTWGEGHGRDGGSGIGGVIGGIIGVVIRGGAVGPDRCDPREHGRHGGRGYPGGYPGPGSLPFPRGGFPPINP